MELNIYTIRDKKAELYNRPFYSNTDATACHSVLMTMLNDPKSEFKEFAADYILYRIGKYNETTAQIESYTPVHISEISDILSHYFEKKEAEERQRGQTQFDFANTEAKEQVKSADKLLGKAKVQAYADNNGKEPSNMYVV